MLDRALLNLLRPLTTATAQRLAAMGMSANALSFMGCGLGLAAALSIALHAYVWGLALLLCSRVCDGLDGAVARATTPTDRGAFLDITLDFVFYASIPLAFAIAQPERNALAAAVLLASFLGTGSSFLAFAVLAEKRGLHATALPEKGFYFLGGLTEGSETIAAFIAMCLWPLHFAAIAYGFAALCAITTVLRLRWGWQALGD
jgi:phosphatidylglycerophosphate synthase